MVFFMAVGSQLSQRSSATWAESSRWRHSGSHESCWGFVFPRSLARLCSMHAMAAVTPWRSFAWVLCEGYPGDLMDLTKIFRG
ncbi:Uncharacterised protein [Dermatophilus congolensis]|uniref:Uncharacterized protein n=1 Tax=Dermatophilus congolensis TaxID=1863 RepID=A0AA46H002_9MICO|nr:Uncharacterised protein [Dermatophilus congolensis]